MIDRNDYNDRDDENNHDNDDDVIDDGDGYDYVENNYHSYEIIFFERDLFFLHKITI